MPAVSKEKIQLPTVNLREALPFLEAAKAAGCNINSILEPLALDEGSISAGSNIVAAAIMYDLIDALARASGDPHCGANLGAKRPFSQLVSIESLTPNWSLGDFLLNVCVEKFQDVNSVTFGLRAEGHRTGFYTVRTTSGRRAPAHVDAYGAASLIALLRKTVGRDWDGNRVLINVCDTTVFPTHYFGVKIAQTNSLGFSVSFPTDWLLRPMALPESDQPDKGEKTAAKSIDDTLPALQSILTTHLHEPGLDTERIAQLCGVGPRTLMRRLSDHGTTLKRELDQLRRQRAEYALTTTSDTVCSIGKSLGYPEPTVFARAFRRWTGMTPTQFRSVSRDNEY